jgi:hypothetical protein
MSRTTARKVFFYCLLAIFCEFYVTFGMYFQPSWAKGWPGGIAEKTAIGTGFGAMGFAWSISLLGLAAPMAARLIEFLPERWRTVAWLTLFTLAFFLALTAACAVFQWLYVNWDLRQPP